MIERVRPAGAGDNVSDETRQQALAECTVSLTKVQGLVDELKTARSEHSNNIKKWKGRGLRPEPLKKAVRDRLLDPADVLLDLHEYIRNRAVQNMPMIQQELQAMWSDVDLGDEQRAEIQRQRWRDDGSFSARGGMARETNPHEGGSEGHQSWDAGWLDSPERIAAEMGNGAERRPARQRSEEVAAPPRRRRAAAQPTSLN